MFQAETKDSVSTSMERARRERILPKIRRSRERRELPPKDRRGRERTRRELSNGALLAHSGHQSIQGIRASGTDHGKVEKGGELHRPRRDGTQDPEVLGKPPRVTGHTLWVELQLSLSGTQ